MNVERRGYVTQQTKCVNRNREERILLAKPYQISKKLVLESYKRVKRNRGAAGIDKVSLEEFEVNLKNNLYKIWNRMSSGTYFPPPVKCVEIPKANGGSRSLGIPTVADRIAQMTAKLYVEPRLDRLFHKDSYGYRPGKSAIQAVSVTRKRCWNLILKEPSIISITPS
jgi:RNA-directed DNA polymerase